MLFKIVKLGIPTCIFVLNWFSDFTRLMYIVLAHGFHFRYSPTHLNIIYSHITFDYEKKKKKGWWTAFDSLLGSKENKAKQPDHHIEWKKISANHVWYEVNI